MAFLCPYIYKNVNCCFIFFREEPYAILVKHWALADQPLSSCRYSCTDQTINWERCELIEISNDTVSFFFFIMLCVFMILFMSDLFSE